MIYKWKFISCFILYPFNSIQIKINISCPKRSRISKMHWGRFLVHPKSVDNC